MLNIADCQRSRIETAGRHRIALAKWPPLKSLQAINAGEGVEKREPSCAAVHACSVMSFSLRGPMDCSPPGSSVHGILQARILEWVTISFSRGSFPLRDRTCISSVSSIGRQILYHWATWEALVAVITHSKITESTGILSLTQGHD